MMCAMLSYASICALSCQTVDIQSGKRFTKIPSGFRSLRRVQVNLNDKFPTKNNTLELGIFCSRHFPGLVLSFVPTTEMPLDYAIHNISRRSLLTKTEYWSLYLE